MAKDKKEKAEGAEKVELTPEEAAAKGKKKKLLMIIIGGVVLTAGIGGGLVFFLAGGKGGEHKESTEEVAAKPEEGHEEGKKEEGHEKKEEGGEKKEGEGGEKKEGEGGEKKEAKDDKNKRPKLPDNADIGCTTPMKSFNLNLGNPLENRYIRLELAIEHGCAEEDKNEITERMPQLRDAIITVTSKKTREFLLSPDGKAQLTYEIRNQINQRMSHPIKDVYITDILIE